MLIKNSSQVIFYHSHFDQGPTRDTNINFKNNFLLHTPDSMIIRMDLQQTFKISKILNKAFGNWVTSKKYDFIN
jgi:hypothetical protein